MNCPFCQELNLLYELVLLPGLYVCQNKMCTFCETPEMFEKLYSKPNIVAKNLHENISFINNSNLINENQVNQNHIQYNTDEEFLHSEDTSSLPIENNILFQEFLNSCNYLSNHPNNSIDNFESHVFVGNETDFFFPSKSNDNVSSVYTDKHIFNTINDSKTKIMEKSLRDDTCLEFFAPKSKVFNWLIMLDNLPQFEKMLQIMSIHLDIFDNVQDLKQEYAINEAFANNYDYKILKYLSQSFVQDICTKLNLSTQPELSSDMSIFDKLICLLCCHLQKYNTEKSLFQFSSKISCSSCNRVTGSSSEEYFLTLDRNEIPMDIGKNTLIHQSVCSKCKKKATKTIKFQSIPKNVIVYCPSGLEGSSIQYESISLSDDNKEELYLINVIETNTDDSMFNSISFEKSPISGHSNFDSGFSIHFRNKNGWYTINDEKNYLISPDESLSIESWHDVRLLIYGKIADPRKYQNSEAAQAFILNHRNFISNFIGKFSKRTTFKWFCKKTLSAKKSVKKRSIKDILALINGVEQPSPLNNEVDFDNCCDDYDYSTPLLSNPLTPHYSQSIVEICPPKSFTTNTSSGVSSAASSLFDKEFSSTSSSDYSGQQSAAQSKKRKLSLDCLINRQCKKLKRR